MSTETIATIGASFVYFFFAYVIYSLVKPHGGGS